MRCALKDTHKFLYSLSQMTATLDLPMNLAVSVLRKAGTGDSLLAALDALVSTNSQESVEETQEPAEWMNALNLENEVEDVTVTL
jgi:hypothetical protein